jgi:hypothetical protein
MKTRSNGLLARTLPCTYSRRTHDTLTTRSRLARTSKQTRTQKQTDTHTKANRHAPCIRFTETFYAFHRRKRS